MRGGDEVLRVGRGHVEAERKQGRACRIGHPHATRQEEEA